MKQSPALKHILSIYNHPPRGTSTQRFGHAMSSALCNAINLGLPFNKNDIVYLAKECQLMLWTGASREGYYSRACGRDRGSDNSSAAVAFETFFKRTPWLWAEKSQKATRLYVGERFTWKGCFVEVTSFNYENDVMVACEVNQDRYKQGFEVGHAHYVDGNYRTIEMIKRYPNGPLCVRFAPKKRPMPILSKKVHRRFTITHSEMEAVRKGYDTRRRELEKAIAAANTLQELDEVSDRSGALGTTREAYRHFDLDILRALFTKRREQIKMAQTEAEERAYEAEQARQRAKELERWVQGEDILRHFTEIRVRIKDNRLEVSNGNSVTLAGAKSALAFALRFRTRGWQSNQKDHFDVDAFRVESVHPDRGVTIGCTRFDWAEIERFRKLVSGKGKR